MQIIMTMILIMMFIPVDVENWFMMDVRSSSRMGTKTNEIKQRGVLYMRMFKYTEVLKDKPFIFICGK